MDSGHYVQYSNLQIALLVERWTCDWMVAGLDPDFCNQIFNRFNISLVIEKNKKYAILAFFKN